MPAVARRPCQHWHSPIATARFSSAARTTRRRFRRFATLDARRAGRHDRISWATWAMPRALRVALPDDAPEPAGMRYVGLRSLFLRIPESLLALAGRAFQVVEWDRTHRFCGRCGTPTRTKADERAKECPTCGYVAYPRVSPAMMALVTRGREVLLARSHRFVNGVYSALAGFVEPGETIEDCVRREVREEVGVEVDDITYFASQSWAFPHSLMIAYTAEYAGGDIRLEDAEIADARWFARRCAAAVAAQRLDRPAPDRRHGGPPARLSLARTPPRAGLLESTFDRAVARLSSGSSIAAHASRFPSVRHRRGVVLAMGGGANAAALRSARDVRGSAQGLCEGTEGRAGTDCRQELCGRHRDPRYAIRRAAARAAGTVPERRGPRGLGQDRRRNQSLPGAARRLSGIARSSQQSRRPLRAEGQLRRRARRTRSGVCWPRRTTPSPTRTWATCMRAWPA